MNNLICLTYQVKWLKNISLKINTFLVFMSTNADTVGHACHQLDYFNIQINLAGHVWVRSLLEIISPTLITAQANTRYNVNDISREESINR